MPTITIPDEEVVTLGQFGAMTVRWKDIPQHVLDHIWKVHSAQFFTDAGNAGGKSATKAERLSLAKKKLEACYAGELRSRTGTPVDPVEAEVQRLAEGVLLKVAKAATAEWKATTGGERSRMVAIFNNRLVKAGRAPCTFEGLIASVLAGPSGAELRKQAQANVAARDKVDVLGVLGL